MTGGPGFGKTTIVKAICASLQRKTPACCFSLMGVWCGSPRRMIPRVMRPRLGRTTDQPSSLAKLQLQRRWTPRRSERTPVHAHQLNQGHRRFDDPILNTRTEAYGESYGAHEISRAIIGGFARTGRDRGGLSCPDCALVTKREKKQHKLPLGERCRRNRRRSSASSSRDVAIVTAHPTSRDRSSATVWLQGGPIGRGRRDDPQATPSHARLARGAMTAQQNRTVIRSPRWRGQAAPAPPRRDLASGRIAATWDHRFRCSYLRDCGPLAASIS